MRAFALLLPAAAALRVPLVLPRCSLSMMSSGGDLSGCTVVQLKEKLRAAGLKVSGRKAELIARLESVTEEPVPLSSSGAFPTIEIEACNS